MSHGCRLLLSTGLVASMPGLLAAQQCRNPVWSSAFSSAGGLVNAAGTCLTVFDPDGPGPTPPALYVGGNFESAGGVAGTKGIARWDGSSWASVGGGLSAPGLMESLGVFDADGPGPGLPVLVAAGRLTSIGGAAVQNTAQWNGVAWSALGTGITDSYWISAMTTFDPDEAGPLPRQLVLAGESIQISAAQSGLATWDGAAWSLLPLTGSSWALAVYDEDGPGQAAPALFFGLDFSPGIKRWDGQQVTAVGTGLGRSLVHMCTSLRVVDEDGAGPGRDVLLAGGWFTMAGGSPANGVARWDGLAWSAIGSGISGPAVQVDDLIGVDYTGGMGAPTLYAVATGLPGIAVMQWFPKNQEWRGAGLLSSGIGISTHKLAAFAGSGGSPSLYVAGGISAVNQIESRGIAQLFCECYGNCDGSSSAPRVNANDFVCFLNSFASGSSYANCDGSTAGPVLTPNDFVCFLDQVAAGCL